MTGANKKFQQLRKIKHKYKVKRMGNIDMSKDDEFKMKDASDVKLQSNKKICPYCNFSAYYPFIRCPECENEFNQELIDAKKLEAKELENEFTNKEKEIKKLCRGY